MNLKGLVFVSLFVFATVSMLCGVVFARMMPGDYSPDQKNERVSEYIPFAVQKTFQPIKYNSDPQVVVVTGFLEKNYKLFKLEKDNESFARDEKKLLYKAFEKLGWRKVNARYHMGDVFGEVEITYTNRNKGPIAHATIKIGGLETKEKRWASEDRVNWFSEEVAEIVNLRVMEQF